MLFAHFRRSDTVTSQIVSSQRSNESQNDGVIVFMLSQYLCSGKENLKSVVGLRNAKIIKSTLLRFTYHAAISNKTCVSTSYTPSFSVSVNPDRKNWISEEQLDSSKKIRSQSSSHCCEHEKVAIVHERRSILNSHPGPVFYKDK